MRSSMIGESFERWLEFNIVNSIVEPRTRDSRVLAGLGVEKCDSAAPENKYRCAI